MPGHVKKTSGPDEDPCPYLVVTLEMKREHAMKPYDPKKSYWCPDGKGNYMECILDEDDGTKAKVSCGHEVQCTLLVLIDFCPVQSEFLTFLLTKTFDISPEIIMEYQIQA